MITAKDIEPCLQIEEAIASGQPTGTLIRNLLNDPGVSEHALAYMTTVRFPDRDDKTKRLLGQLAAHPKLGANSYDYVCKYGDIHARGAIARKPDIPAALQTQLAKDPYYKVRMALIDNPATPSAIIEQLVNDKHPRVAADAKFAISRDPKQLKKDWQKLSIEQRAQIARTPDLHVGLLEAVVNDKAALIRDAFATSNDHPKAYIDQAVALSKQPEQLLNMIKGNTKLSAHTFETLFKEVPQKDIGLDDIDQFMDEFGNIDEAKMARFEKLQARNQSRRGRKFNSSLAAHNDVDRHVLKDDRPVEKRFRHTLEVDEDGKVSHKLNASLMLYGDVPTVPGEDFLTKDLASESRPNFEQVDVENDDVNRAIKFS